MKSLIKQVVVGVFDLFRKIIGQFDPKNKVYFLGTTDPAIIQNITERFRFYAPHLELTILGKNELRFLDIFKIQFGLNPILIWGQDSRIPFWLRKLRSDIYDVNFTTNPGDGWEWVRFGEAVATVAEKASDASSRFNEIVAVLKTQKKNKVFLFGTGPSLDWSWQKTWNDGYRVVCNTIVRDKELFDFISPDFIAAGDAIYHFGHTDFARAFRKDLKRRLSETKVHFIYPAQFHMIVIRELGEFKERLIPIPVGKSKSISNDLTKDFHLPALGNALALLLLPVGCTLSRNVYLWGFDGRAPTDKLFWSNSIKHSYPELMGSLQAAHPKFYDHHVPKEDPNKYVKTVLGDVLEEAFNEAENKGWSFTMMHFSWTRALQKRFKVGFDIPRDEKPAHYGTATT
ncbi:MAG: hypothetical protein JWQ35_600 [Bacteriovoracaceae bacterium]|nr:hypothetical protein [Bacteriovoracaceae bacterium]